MAFESKRTVGTVPLLHFSIVDSRDVDVCEDGQTLAGSGAELMDCNGKRLSIVELWRRRERLSMANARKPQPSSSTKKPTPKAAMTANAIETLRSCADEKQRAPRDTSGNTPDTSELSPLCVGNDNGAELEVKLFQNPPSAILTSQLILGLPASRDILARLSHQVAPLQTNITVEDISGVEKQTIKVNSPRTLKIKEARNRRADLLETRTQCEKTAASPPQMTRKSPASVTSSFFDPDLGQTPGAARTSDFFYNYPMPLGHHQDQTTPASPNKGPLSVLDRWQKRRIHTDTFSSPQDNSPSSNRRRGNAKETQDRKISETATSSDTLKTKDRQVTTSREQPYATARATSEMGLEDRSPSQTDSKQHLIVSSRGDQGTGKERHQTEERNGSGIGKAVQEKQGRVGQVRKEAGTKPVRQSTMTACDSNHNVTSEQVQFMLGSPWLLLDKHLENQDVCSLMEPGDSLRGTDTNYSLVSNSEVHPSARRNLELSFSSVDESNSNPWFLTGKTGMITGREEETFNLSRVINGGMAFEGSIEDDLSLLLKQTSKTLSTKNYSCDLYPLNVGRQCWNERPTHEPPELQPFVPSTRRANVASRWINLNAKTSAQNFMLSQTSSDRPNAIPEGHPVCVDVTVGTNHPTQGNETDGIGNHKSVGQSWKPVLEGQRNYSRTLNKSKPENSELPLRSSVTTSVALGPEYCLAMKQLESEPQLCPLVLEDFLRLDYSQESILSSRSDLSEPISTSVPTMESLDSSKANVVNHIMRVGNSQTMNVPMKSALYASEAMKLSSSCRQNGDKKDVRNHAEILIPVKGLKEDIQLQVLQHQQNEVRKLELKRSCSGTENGSRNLPLLSADGLQANASSELMAPEAPQTGGHRLQWIGSTSPNCTSVMQSVDLTASRMTLSASGSRDIQASVTKPKAKSDSSVATQMDSISSFASKKPSAEGPPQNNFAFKPEVGHIHPIEMETYAYDESQKQDPQPVGKVAPNQECVPVTSAALNQDIRSDHGLKSSSANSFCQWSSQKAHQPYREQATDLHNNSSMGTTIAFTGFESMGCTSHADGGNNSGSGNSLRNGAITRMNQANNESNENSRVCSSSDATASLSKAVGEPGNLVRNKRSRIRLAYLQKSKLRAHRRRVESFGGSPPVLPTSHVDQGENEKSTDNTGANSSSSISIVPSQAHQEHETSINNSRYKLCSRSVNQVAGLPQMMCQAFSPTRVYLAGPLNPLETVSNDEYDSYSSRSQSTGKDFAKGKLGRDALSTADLEIRGARGHIKSPTFAACSEQCTSEAGHLNSRVHNMSPAFAARNEQCTSEAGHSDSLSFFSHAGSAFSGYSTCNDFVLPRTNGTCPIPSIEREDQGSISRVELRARYLTKRVLSQRPIRSSSKHLLVLQGKLIQWPSSLPAESKHCLRTGLASKYNTSSRFLDNDIEATCSTGADNSTVSSAAQSSHANSTHGSDTSHSFDSTASDSNVYTTIESYNSPENCQRKMKTFNEESALKESLSQTLQDVYQKLLGNVAGSVKSIDLRQLASGLNDGVNTASDSIQKLVDKNAKKCEEAACSLGARTISSRSQPNGCVCEEGIAIEVEYVSDSDDSS